MKFFFDSMCVYVCIGIFIHICIHTHACMHSYIPTMHTRVTVFQLWFIHILWFSINCCTYFSWRILEMLHGEFFSSKKLGGKSIFTNNNNMMGFPCGLAGKESPCNVGDLDPWVGKISWRRERLPTPVFWPREFQGLYSPWGHRKSDTTERLSLSQQYDMVTIYICMYVCLEQTLKGCFSQRPDFRVILWGFCQWGWFFKNSADQVQSITLN